jgi:hypothetical protein
MDNLEQQALLKTNASKGREPLARFLSSQKNISYYDALRCLKVAPRSKGLFSKGRTAALKLLGKDA